MNRLSKDPQGSVFTDPVLDSSSDELLVITGNTSLPEITDRVHICNWGIIIVK